MPSLTKREIGILAEGAVHRDGVVRPMIHPGYDGITTRRSIKKLEQLGLIEPNAHGDHYITDAGRAALGKA